VKIIESLKDMNIKLKTIKNPLPLYSFSKKPNQTLKTPKSFIPNSNLPKSIKIPSNHSKINPLLSIKPKTPYYKKK
jgi:hypothetical protein